MSVCFSRQAPESGQVGYTEVLTTSQTIRVRSVFFPKHFSVRWQVRSASAR